MRPLGRRQFVLGGFGSLLGGGCTRRNDVRTPRGFGGALRLHSWFDLPDDQRSRELSGIAWDAREEVLWAVQDNTRNIVELLPQDRDLSAWAFGTSILLDVEGALDLEGLVLLDDGFVVCSEEGPRVLEVDRGGRFRREIVLPPRFREARTNKSLESLTASPSGRYLFTTTEVALAGDGAKATTSAGTKVRIVRVGFERNQPELFGHEVSEHVYETDPVVFANADWGVADLAALDDSTLLVLERGWMKGYGNTARIYEVSLDDRSSCLGVDHLTTAVPPLKKTLRIDLGTLASPGLPRPKQPQPSAILDNYEGMALGPTLADGRRTLLVVSDDNGHLDQVARLLVLVFG